MDNHTEQRFSGAIAGLSGKAYRFVQNSLLPWWQDYRWPTIGALWLLSFVLGSIGIQQYDHWNPSPRPPSVLDVLYRAMQLFVLNWSGPGPVPWELNTGRFLSPFMAAYTATEALALLFFDQFQLMRARRIHDHVIICGLGNKGLLLAKAFRARGLPVLMIEKNADNDLIQACRQQNILVFIGSASKPDVLRRARLQAAKVLIAVCGDDSVNAEVASHAREIVAASSPGSLTCATHIVNPDLWYLLRRWEVTTGDSFRLQFFNVFDIGARAMLDTYPPFSEETGDDCSPPHLLIVGAANLGQSLIVHAARRWQNRQSACVSGGKLGVTLVDSGAERVHELLGLRHPELSHVCDIHPLNLAPAEFQRAGILVRVQKNSPFTAVYICYEDDALGLSAALELRHQLSLPGVPIVIGMTQVAGLATLLDRVGTSSSGFQRLHAFGLLDQACQPDLVLGGTNEILARAIHERYLREQLKAGQSDRTNPALVPWDQLSEALKESNRRQADHLGVKLQAIGCDIAPLTDWDAASFALAPPEEEMMGRLEHERWVEERRSQGWTYGPRDPEKKTNPSLVSWEELSEEGRELNRATIRQMPASLAQAGFQIYRLSENGSESVV